MHWIEEPHRTHSLDSRSPACSKTPASLRICTRAAAGHTSSGCTLRNHRRHRHRHRLHFQPNTTKVTAASPQSLRGQQLLSSARLTTTSPARPHTGTATLEQLYSTGTMESLSQRYMQQASLEAFHTSPCARGTPAWSVQAVNENQIEQVQSNVAHLPSHRRFRRAYRTSPVGCRGRSRVGGGASLQGKRSPPSSPNTGRGQSRSHGRGRTGRCSPTDRPDTAEGQDT